MKHINFIMAFVILIILMACREDSDSQLITSTTQLIFSPDGGSQTIAIESNTGWKIVSNASWLSVYPSTGYMNQDITITAAVKNNKLEQETKIIISTNDGRKVVNVTVKIEGSEVKSGKYLDIYNHNKVFSGKAGEIDSLEITSNITWEVLGPEWIEAWDGGRWHPLSQERGVIRENGTTTVFLRTALDNNKEDELEDVVIVKEYLSGDFTHTMTVCQVGRKQVRSHFIWVLEDGLVFNWKSGNNVKNIYYKVTDNLNYKIPFENVVRSTFEKTDENYVNSATDLKPGTKYLMIVVGEDEKGIISKDFHTYIIKTDEEGMARADIAKGDNLGGGQWRFFISSDTGIHGTKDFSLYATDKPNSAFRYNDPILWLIAGENWERGYWLNNWYKGSQWVYWNNLSGKSDEIHAMTYAAGLDGYIRHKVFRYDRYFDTNGNRLPQKPLLDRIPKALINHPSLR